MADKEGKQGLKQKNPTLYIVLDWVKIIVIALAAALFINFVIVINSQVPSGSMEPTIMTGSRMLGFRLSYMFSSPKQGDIIIFKYPDDPSQIFVKRVIGLPGDKVEIIGGVTYVNGEPLQEDYLKETPLVKDFGPYDVPEDCYFVLGDNRNNSRDSRYWTNTFVPRNSILGKAVLVYWPFSEFGGIK